MSRSQILALLAVAVVGFGFISWLGPGRGLQMLTAPAPSHTPSPTARARVPCIVTLSGSITDCAVSTADSTTVGACSVGSDSMHARVHLRGDARDYLLYVALVGSYYGPAEYPLWPWGNVDLGAPDVPKVALREADTGALWESSDGSLTIGADGMSGTLDARLGYVSGLRVAPLGLLSVTGHWSCVQK